MVVFIFMVHVDVFAVTPSTIFSLVLFKKKNKKNQCPVCSEQELEVQHGK